MTHIVRGCQPPPQINRLANLLVKGLAFELGLFPNSGKSLEKILPGRSGFLQGALHAFSLRFKTRQAKADTPGRRLPRSGWAWRLITFLTG